MLSIRHVRGVNDDPVAHSPRRPAPGARCPYGAFRRLRYARAVYTGEDGFELSLPAPSADRVARLLLAQPEVEPIGLGARDSLRLEAGLCLYGHELSTAIDPVQAGLVWSIGKARRPGGERAGGFPGAEKIFHVIERKPALRRVGLVVDGKRPASRQRSLWRKCLSSRSAISVAESAPGQCAQARRARNCCDR